MRARRPGTSRPGWPARSGARELFGMHRRCFGEAIPSAERPGHLAERPGHLAEWPGYVCALWVALALLAGCHRADAPNLAAQAASSSNTTRVVSLAPSITEIVCAVGAADRLVGRTDVCNYPSDVVAHVPVVAGFGRPYLEPILSEKPTLVLDVALEDTSLRAALERQGIRCAHVACQHLDEIPDAIRDVGRLAGRADAAGALATSIADGIRRRREAEAGRPAARRPLVLALIWYDPLMVAAKASFVSELVALAGGRNLGDELPRDYVTVSTEWVIERSPDVILCLYHGAESRARQIVMTHTGWQTIRAVQTGRVYDDFNLDTILRPGPRVLQGEEQLRSAIEGTAQGQ